MKSSVILKKIESLERCIVRVQDKKPSSLNELEGSLDLQDIIILNLERAIQQCVDIALHIMSDYSDFEMSTMSATFKGLAEKNIISSALADNLSRSVGFRNVAVHEYRSLSWDVVWYILEHRLDDFREFSHNIVKLF